MTTSSLSRSLADDRLELHPAGPDVAARGNCPRAGVAGAEDVRRAVRPPVIGPVEGYLGRVLPSRTADQVDLGPQVGLAPCVAEAHAHSGDVLLGDGRGAEAEALRPEVLRLLAPAGDGPVFDHWPPRPTAVRAEIDVVEDVRPRRVARRDLRRRVDLDGRLTLRRGQLHRNARRR